MTDQQSDDQTEQTDDQELLTIADVEATGLEDWRMLFDVLHARFATGSFMTGVELVRRLADAAEEMNHHPDVVLTYPQVDVRLTSHDVGGITARDLRLARTISELAAAAGAEAQPAALATVELGLDTPDHAAVKAFWAAVLGYDGGDGDGDELTDPDGMKPTVWFQQSEGGPATGGGQRWHLDVRVPPETAQERVDATLAAGGRLVSDDAAPAYWVLEDAQGNRACVCTGHGRDGQG